tara:strand:+ start:193 stop:552 length:360 start_codon:yes stop_codon:yes gene_type:complete
MTWYILFSVLSVVLNGFLIWYTINVLRKLMFVSDNLSDLYLVTQAFLIFAATMYSMDKYHGEPMIQELLYRLKDVKDEVETFREVFQYTLDVELEEELEEQLHGPQEEAQQKPLFYESS